MVTVYSKNNCVKCQMVKRYLDAHAVTYKEINIEETPSARDYLLAQGFSSLPIIMKDNQAPVVGFSPEIFKSWAS